MRLKRWPFDLETVLSKGAFERSPSRPFADVRASIGPHLL
jgi:hypothetical protein